MSKSLEQALVGTRFFPFWLDNDFAPAPEKKLNGEITTDLLIVGSGFTGLWAAVQAKENDCSREVVVIEAASAAAGASGRPGAVLSTSLIHGLENSRRLFSDEVAELERLGRENMDQLRETIERYQIDCDVEWTGELVVAVGAGGLDKINRKYELLDRYGHEATLLDRSSVNREISSPLFDGGLWTRKRSGTIHPAKLAWGLRRVAKKLGVAFYDNSPMLTSRGLENSVLVRTPQGTIHAHKVILATNSFTKHKKKISNHVAAIRDRIIMTEPLSVEQLGSLGWRNRQGVSDTSAQLKYMRLTKDNRILYGGRPDYFFNNETDPEFDRTPTPYIPLLRKLYNTFPSLEGVKITHAWSGPIALTTRMIMHFKPFHGGRMIYAGGFSGFGVAASRFAARMSLAIVDDEDIPERRLKLLKLSPGWIPPEPFRWLGAKLTMYALDTHADKGGWRIYWLKLLAKFGFPLKP